MDFGTNLAAARRAKGLSQEELADKLNVSRQTIYKWETGVTYPDVDKLCEMARVLDVSTAYLLGEQGAQMQPDAADTVPTACTPLCDKAGTVRHFKGFANVIGLCTMAILLGVGLFVAIGGLGGDNAALWGLIPFLAIIFGAVIGYVIAGIRHDHYLKENSVEISFEKEEKQREQRVFTVKIAVGLSLIFLGVLFLILGGVLDSDRLAVIATAVLLALVGVACYFFITAGIMYDLYMGKESPKKNHEKKPELYERICGLITLLATAVFLLLGFVWNLWHPAWVAFPIGGILCGCVFLIWGDKKE